MNKKELNFILQQGENQFIEFKESIDHSFSKEVVAFANASGGRILIGITDKGLIKGILISNYLKSQIQDIAKNCDPTIIINIESFEQILVVEVAEGVNKPYSCKDGFYLRMGTNSQKLTRDEILEFAITEGKKSFDEEINNDFNYDLDFDIIKYKEYLKEAKIKTDLDDKSILINLGVAKLIKNNFKFNNTGVLFFAKNPDKFFINSKVICVEYATNDKVDILDRKIYDDGILENIKQSINFLKKKITVKFEIKIKRKEIPQYPEDAYREAIVNAIVHRDYFDRTSDVLIENYRNKIIIYNPGGLVKWLKATEFGKISKCRNLLIASLLSKTIYAEKIGTGIRRIIKSMKAANLPKLKFTYYDHSFYVELKDGAKSIKNEPLNEPLNKNNLILNYILNHPMCKRKEISKNTNVSLGALKRNLQKLIDNNKIKKIGSKKTGGYIVKK